MTCRAATAALFLVATSAAQAVAWVLAVGGPSLLALGVHWLLLLTLGWPFAVLWSVAVLIPFALAGAAGGASNCARSYGRAHGLLLPSKQAQSQRSRP